MDIDYKSLYYINDLSDHQNVAKPIDSYQDKNYDIFYKKYCINDLSDHQSDTYKSKYYKYKKKYLELKQKAGSGASKSTTEQKETLFPLTPCCASHNTIIIKSHGSLTNNPEKHPMTFTLPEGANLITLTQINNNCPLNVYFDKEIKSFYEAGYTIFENNDKSTNKTEQGKSLEATLKVRYPHIIIRNHVGPIEVNNHILSFVGNCNVNKCSIDCIGKDIPSVTNCLYKNTKNENIKTVTLEKIIYDYEGWLNKSYILIACRPIPKGTTSDQINLMRQTSNNN